MVKQDYFILRCIIMFTLVGATCWPIGFVKLMLWLPLALIDLRYKTLVHADIVTSTCLN